MVKKFLVIILLLFLHSVSLTYGIEKIDHFQHFNEKNGLVNGVVSCTQDLEGFLWFGTEGGNGVFRYNGKKFEQFVHEPSNPNSILPGDVYSIICDKEGQLWFATMGGGLSSYDPNTGVFTNYKHSDTDPNTISDNTVYSIMEDSKGGICIATGKSLDLYNKSTGEMKHFYPKTDGSDTISTSTIFHMYESKDGMIWIGTYGGGLYMYNPVLDSFTAYRHDPNDLSSIAHNTCGAIVEDKEGYIWVGGKGGVNRLNRETGKFTRYIHDPNNSYSLKDDYVWDMVFDSEGNLWTGGFGGGLGKLNIETGKVKRFNQTIENPDSITSNLIWFVFKDRENILWIGTPDGGLNKYIYSSEQFSHYSHMANDPNSFPVKSLTTIFQDSNDDIWVAGQGHESGLSHWNLKSGEIVTMKPENEDKNSVPSGEILSIVEDNKGDLIIGQFGGVTRFDKETGVFQRIFPRDVNGSNTSDTLVQEVVVDNKNNIWVCSENGLFYLNEQSDEVTVYFEGESITRLFLDSFGNVWVGTLSNGIKLRQNGEKEWKEYRHHEQSSESLSSGKINEIMEDSHGRVWIGTNGGLNLWQPDTESFKTYSTSHGFLSNSIYSILEDTKGYLWIGTANGLTQFNFIDETIKNFTATDGLQSNEFSMRSNGAIKSKDGQFYFVGKNGLTVFDPLTVKHNHGSPNAVLTSIKILNEEIDFNKKDFINSQLELSWKDSMITFEFIALDFLDSRHINYAYKLEGFDKDWIEIGNESIATYTNLDPGTYNFRVKVSTQPGVWNEKALSLPIHIIGPWWLTTWAKIMFGLISLVIIYFYVSHRTNRLESINKDLEEKVYKRTQALEIANEELGESLRALEKRSKELESTTTELMSKERLASLGSLVAGVSHEINTPIGVALTASSYLTKKNNETYKLITSGKLSKSNLVEYINTVDESSEIVFKNLQRASELVQSFKKIAVNQSYERKSKFDLTDYLNSVILTLKHEYKNKNREINVCFEEEIWIESYPSAFSQIFTNLIMNSLIHGFADMKYGEILIDIKVKEDSLILTHKDNGIGIPQEFINRIFDPFFTTNQLNGGSGLGLSIIYNIITDKLQGSIKCKSDEGEGTTFTIELPIVGSIVGKEV